MIAARQGRRTLRAVAMGAEPGPRALGPGCAERDDVQDPTPWVGGVKPFLLQSSSQFRSAGPNALTSAAYTAEFIEVKRLGGDGW